MRKRIGVPVACVGIVLLACLLGGSPTSAQQSNADVPASKADIERFFEAMHTREMVNKMMETMQAQTRQMIRQQVAQMPNLPPDFEAKEEAFVDRMWKNFPLEDMLQAMIPAYQRHFTKSDIDSFVAFYSSPAGQKLTNELPAVTAEAMQASQGIIQKMVAQEMEHIRNDIAQAQKQAASPN